MCRSTDFQRFHADKDRLKIRGFFVQFSGLKSKTPLLDSLTLLFLPRINENFLEIDGSKIRPDSPAFLTLHRVISSSNTKDVVFGSRERVRAGEGVRFEVHMSEEKVVKGIFRKDEDEEWKLECTCALESEMVGFDVEEAEVCVDVEGHVAMHERMAMVANKKKTTKRFSGLDEIPEQREMETESDDCCCSCGESGIGSDGEDSEGEEGEEEEREMDVEGVRWAVDVGIWVMCLGVGLLVSRASAKRLRRKIIL